MVRIGTEAQVESQKKPNKHLWGKRKERKKNATRDAHPCIFLFSHRKLKILQWKKRKKEEDGKHFPILPTSGILRRREGWILYNKRVQQHITLSDKKRSTQSCWKDPRIFWAEESVCFVKSLWMATQRNKSTTNPVCFAIVIVSPQGNGVKGVE